MSDGCSNTVVFFSARRWDISNAQFTDVHFMQNYGLFHYILNYCVIFPKEVYDCDIKYYKSNKYCLRFA